MGWSSRLNTASQFKLSWLMVLNFGWQRLPFPLFARALVLVS